MKAQAFQYQEFGLIIIHQVMTQQQVEEVQVEMFLMMITLKLKKT
jgi:hypothetical protein